MFGPTVHLRTRDRVVPGVHLESSRKPCRTHLELLCGGKRAIPRFWSANACGTVLVYCLLLRPVGDAKWWKGRVSFNYRNVCPRPTTSKQRREHTAHAQQLQPACNAACTGADAPQKTNMPSQRALPAPAAAAGAPFGLGWHVMVGSGGCGWVRNGSHCARMTTATGESTGSSLPHEKQRSG